MTPAAIRICLQVYLAFQSYEMTHPQSCDDAFVEVYDRTTAMSDKQKKYCGNEAKHFKSSSNHFYVHLHSANPFQNPQFNAIFTIFTEGNWRVGEKGRGGWVS